jgi:hypothetical protein
LKKPGLDNLRFEHLRQMMGTNYELNADQAIFMENFTSFINLILAGKIPNLILALFRENEKWTVPKGNNDFRPLEGTSVLRKIASAVINRSEPMRDYITTNFKDVQYAMQKLGTEKIIHTFNLAKDRWPEKDQFYCDGDNAFNRLNREFMLYQTMTTFPAIFPFVKSMYEGCTGAWIYGSNDGIQRIEITDGVTQGCSLGSFLYALGSLPFVKGLQSRLSEQEGNNFTKFFVDDGNITADFDSMIRAIQYIELEGPKVGYFLKKNKGSYLIGRCGRDVALERKRMLIDRFGLHENVIHIHPSDTTEETAKTEYGANVLGSFIGSSDYVRKMLEEKLRELRCEAETLTKFSDPQVRNLMFRFRFCQKVNHLQRCLGPQAPLKDFIDFYEEEKKKVLTSLLQPKYSRVNLPERVWMQAQLPINAGGLGYHFTADVTESAYIASIIDTREELENTFPGISQELLNAHLHANSPWIQKIADALKTIGEKQYDDAVNMSWQDVINLRTTIPNEDDNEFESTTTKSMQEVISKSFTRKKLTRFASSIEDTHELAWFTSLAAKHAGAWLDVCPKIPTTTISPAKFTCALFYRLHLDQPSIIEGSTCSCNGSPTLDLRGIHLTTACGKDGFRHRMHDMVTLVISKLTRSCGIMTIREEHGCFHEADPDSDKRPDLSLYNAPGLHGRKLVLDASITCPYPSRGARLSRTNALLPLRQANSVYKRKVDKYGDIAFRNRIEFLPLIAESTGRLHPQMTNFLNTILKDKSGGDNFYYGKLKRFWYTQISCTIQNALADSLLTRASRINGRVSSSMAGDYTMSDSTIDRFGHLRVPR